ncbi:hypothetical protein Tco_1409108 [Tanacetum coccineum]
MITPPLRMLYFVFYKVEDISPITLEAAKTLSRVASLEPKSIDKGRRYKRRKETKGKKVVSSLDFQEEVNAGAEGVNTGSIKLSTVSEQVSTGSEQVSTSSEQVSTVSAKRSTPSPDKGQRAGKAPKFYKRKLALLKQSDWILYRKKRRLNKYTWISPQHYTDEDWDLIRAKIKANAKLSKKVKEEFDKLVKQVESFAPINFEATKASLKRFGEELQTKTPKRLKSDEVKDVEPTKKSGKRRKQMARKGLHTSDLDKDDSEGSNEVSEQDNSVIESTLFELRVSGYIYVVERKYPLSAEICKTMLDKKLQGGKPDEDCYKMLKMMEKQAGIRK